jgi:hypothetical protein
MVTLRAEPDPGRSLGHARIVLQGLATPPADPAFCIRREGYPAPNLGLGGWQVREERLKPLHVAQEGGDTVLVVGPAVTRHLEPAPFIFLLPEAGIEQALFWPDTIDVFDGELPPEDDGAEALRQAEERRREEDRRREEERRRAEDLRRSTRQPVIDPVPTPVQTPTPPVVAVAKPPSRLPLYAALAVVVLAAGGAAAWFLMPRPEPVIAVAPPPPAAPAAAPAPPPPRPAPPWLERADAMPLRELVDSAPDAAAIHAAALRRQAAGRHDDALLLFEEAGERGHAPALTALARLYDPTGFVAGRPFRNPDPRAAARYYREAVQKGDAAAEAPRASLKTTLEEQARTGNGTAETALREFWP